MSDPGAQVVRPLGTGPGRALLAAYALLALAAGARSIIQIATKFNEAPFAYLMSAAAAVLYAVIVVALVRTGPQWRRVARIGILIELAGVLIVGTLSVIDSSLFPKATVWSGFGMGYVFLPLVLPILGLLWLRREGSGRVTN